MVGKRRGRTGWAGDLNQALNRAEHCITHCSLVRTQMQLNALIWLDVDLEDRYLLFYKCHCGVLTLCFKLVSFFTLIFAVFATMVWHFYVSKRHVTSFSPLDNVIDQSS